MTDNDDPNGVDEFDFDDLGPTFFPGALKYIPAANRQHARDLPPSEAWRLMRLTAPGGGHNNSLKPVARYALLAHDEDDRSGAVDEVWAFLDELYEEGRPRTDLDHAIKNALADIQSGVTHKASRTIPVDLKKLQRLGPTTKADIAKKDKATNRGPEDLLPMLFSKGDLICATGDTTKGIPKLFTLEEITERSDLRERYFISPSTYRTKEGVKIDGNDYHSTRCDANAKGCRWMILECDLPEELQRDQFNTFAFQMAKFAPLVMAVDSGGKSVHYWFKLPVKKRSAVKQFWDIAQRYGADRRLNKFGDTTPSVWVRMPNAKAQPVSEGKEPRRSQTVLYFDPDAGGISEWDLEGFRESLGIANPGPDDLGRPYYYCSADSKSYVGLDNLGRWESYNRQSLISHLAEVGIYNTKADGDLQSEAEKFINKIELNHGVDEVLPRAAGWGDGLHTEGGLRFMVKRGPRFIEPVAGEWPTLKSYIERLFGADPVQVPIFMGWLARAARLLRTNAAEEGQPFRSAFGQSQMLTIAGPPGIGKTFLLNHVLEPCFAQVSIDAGPLFNTKATDFNADMFGAELLCLDDCPHLSAAKQYRRFMGDRIRQIVAGRGMAYHAKQKTRVNIAPNWRLVRLMNDEPTDLETLPLLDEGIEDKLIILRAQDIGESNPWFEAAQNVFSKEMPAFLHFLLHEFELPKEAADPEHNRFGVRSYINPSVKAVMEECSSEAATLAMIDGPCWDAIFNAGDNADRLLGVADEFNDETGETNKPKVAKLTVAQLRNILVNTGRSGKEFKERHCQSDAQLRTVLEHLKKTHPHRVKKSTNENELAAKYKGVFYWGIYPEPKAEFDDEALGML